jgi:hypothetical protein
MLSLFMSVYTMKDFEQDFLEAREWADMMADKEYSGEEPAGDTDEAAEDAFEEEQFF